MQRRLSEPSGGMPINSRCQRPNTSHQMNGGSNVPRLENENIDKCSSAWNEIEAGDVRDGKQKAVASSSLFRCLFDILMLISLLFETRVFIYF